MRETYEGHAYAIEKKQKARDALQNKRQTENRQKTDRKIDRQQ